MTEEVEVQTAPPAASAAPENPSEAPAEATAAPTAHQPTAAAEEPKKTPWFQTRIDHLTKEKWEAKREAEELRRQLSQRASEAQPNGAPAIDQESLQRMAREQAAQMLKEQTFNDACNRVYESGKKEIGSEFDAAIQNFNMLGGLSAHPDLVEVATAIPDGHKVLHHLGTNLDEAARIINLPPIQKALAIAELSGKLKNKPISAAPAPIKPISSVGSPASSGPDDNGNFQSQDAFRKWREQSRKKA
jgi:hypothetical protein